MKRILLLTTGGTIASVDGGNGLAPGMKPDELLTHVTERNKSHEIDTHSLLELDSTNMHPTHWVQIAEAVEKFYDQYDGFVITHGTDTMAYTSAALSYMLQNPEKPIVITGSQIPISYTKTDAIRNMADAVQFACEGIPGVYIVFDGRVIQGTRAIKLRTKSYDAFESINYPYVASIHDSNITYLRPPAMNGSWTVDTTLSTDVALVKLFPGIQSSLLDYIKDHGYRGLVIESYGSGGVPFDTIDLVSKLKELTDSGVAVVITTQCLEEGEDMLVYEVGRKLDQDIVVRSRNMNTEAIVPKLMWALGKTSDPKEVKRIMETPIAEDLTIIEE